MLYEVITEVFRFLNDDQGLTVTEYAVAAGLIAATLTVTFGNLGTTIDAIRNNFV